MPCLVFDFNFKATGNLPVSGPGKAWIGISDGLPHQADIEGAVSGYPFTSHLVYSYGVNFDIQPPV